MPKIVQNLQKCPKLYKKAKTFNKMREKTNKKLHSCEKLAHMARPLRPSFSISGAKCSINDVNLVFSLIRSVADNTSTFYSSTHEMSQAEPRP